MPATCTTVKGRKRCSFCEKRVEDDADRCVYCGHVFHLSLDTQDRRIGEIIEGRYRVVNLIARGGMGIVYLGERLSCQEYVAIKLLPDHVLSNTHMTERFFREIRAIGRINHAYVPAILDFGRLDDGTLFMVMEYVDGQTLGSRLALCDHFEPPLVLRISIQLSEVLAAAHALDIVHRDIKPNNVMLTTDEEGACIIKVLDFGVAKLIGDNVTKTGDILGTPEYMSPEQVLGQQVDHRSDLYSLGVLLYLMLTGTLPFRGETCYDYMEQQVLATPMAPSKRRIDIAIPSSFDDIVLCCLRKEPRHRFGSAKELLAALRRLATADHLLSAQNKRETTDNRLSDQPTLVSGSRESVPALASGEPLHFGGDDTLLEPPDYIKHMMLGESPSSDSECATVELDGHGKSKSNVKCGELFSEPEGMDTAVMCVRRVDSNGAPSMTTTHSEQSRGNRNGLDGRMVRPFRSRHSLSHGLDPHPRFSTTFIVLVTAITTIFAMMIVFMLWLHYQS